MKAEMKLKHLKSGSKNPAILYKKNFMFYSSKAASA